MFTAALDASGSAENRIFVKGLVAPDGAWDEFSKEWRERLAQDLHFKAVKPVQVTGASQLNFVALDTNPWEQVATFQNNDHTKGLD